MKKQLILIAALIILLSAFWCEIGFKLGYNTAKKESQIDSIKLRTINDAELFINHSKIK